MVKLLPSFISVNPMHCKSIVKGFSPTSERILPSSGLLQSLVYPWTMSFIICLILELFIYIVSPLRTANSLKTLTCVHPYELLCV